MFKKKLIAAMTAAVIAMAIFGGNGNVFAHEGQEHEGAKSLAENVESPQQKEICPVSGEEIDNKSKVTYTYEGKAYDLCCADCAEKFKKDPKKYIETTNGEATEEPMSREGHGHDHH